MKLEAFPVEFSKTDPSFSPVRPEVAAPNWDPGFHWFKRCCDIGFALFALPIIAALAAILLLINPLANRGSLFFRQTRMGQGGRKFKVWKFRTMMAADPRAARSFDAPLEEDRVTPLGALLRRSRLDELPNFLNVLAGDMSLVGPRPDLFEHADAYCSIVPGYAARLRVRPGITGLAQIRGGYADTIDAVHRKARFDQIYVRHAGFRLDTHIIIATLGIMITGFGAK